MEFGKEIKTHCNCVVMVYTYLCFYYLPTIIPRTHFEYPLLCFMIFKGKYLFQFKEENVPNRFIFLRIHYRMNINFHL